MKQQHHTLISDTQNETDQRRTNIQRVGIKGVRYPIILNMGVNQPTQTSVASWTMDVALPAEKKGTHMSRFVAWLNDLTQPLDALELSIALHQMLQTLEATQGQIECSFSFFLRKTAPVSGAQSLLEYQGRWIAQTRPEGTIVWSEVIVPVKSLCPCSKAISDYGAHNQRSHVTLKVELLQPMYWSQLVRFAEDNASCEIWPMLKRADEKWVTEHAYNNPKFVEDMVRDIALSLNQDARIGRYQIDVENFESIHAHSAFAVIERNSL